jgi:hypothetical protein
MNVVRRAPSSIYVGDHQLAHVGSGTMILRTHVERHLPGSLTAPNHLERWRASVNTLLREGLFRQSGNEKAV